MSLEENKALVRRMLEWWPGGDTSVLDETCTDGLVLHGPGATYPGREVIKERLSGHIAVFEERTLIIEYIFGEGDWVAVRYIWSGVMASGRRVEMKKVEIYRFEGEKIAEEWEEYDTKSLAEQTRD